MLGLGLVVDLGVGRDRVLAGGQGIGEADEARLLLGITRDFMEATLLLLPIR